MRLFEKLLDLVRPPVVVEMQHCDHETLTPMWESVADMGLSDRISRYKCESCYTVFPASAVDQEARTAA